MQKRALICLFIALLCLPLCACPLATANNATDQALLNMLRIVKNTDRASELIETLYCPTCEAHLISKDAALAGQRACLKITDYSEKSYKLLKNALDLQTGTLRLTAAARAELESYTTAMRAHVPDANAPGITSPAAAKLAPVLAPLQAAIEAFSSKLAKLKSTVGDAVFEVSLTPQQIRAFEQMEAEIR